MAEALGGALPEQGVNWRTTEADVDLITDVVRELGGRALVAA
jgi:hypothetical protein